MRLDTPRGNQGNRNFPTAVAVTWRNLSPCLDWLLIKEISTPSLRNVTHTYTSWSQVGLVRALQNSPVFVIFFCKFSTPYAPPRLPMKNHVIHRAKAHRINAGVMSFYPEYIPVLENPPFRSSGEQAEKWFSLNNEDFYNYFRNEARGATLSLSLSVDPTRAPVDLPSRFRTCWPSRKRRRRGSGGSVQAGV